MKSRQILARALTVALLTMICGVMAPQVGFARLDEGGGISSPIPTPPRNTQQFSTTPRYFQREQMREQRLEAAMENRYFSGTRLSQQPHTFPPPNVCPIRDPDAQPQTQHGLPSIVFSNGTRATRSLIQVPAGSGVQNNWPTIHIDSGRPPTIREKDDGRPLAIPSVVKVPYIPAGGVCDPKMKPGSDYYAQPGDKILFNGDAYTIEPNGDGSLSLINPTGSYAALSLEPNGSRVRLVDHRGVQMVIPESWNIGYPQRGDRNLNSDRRQPH